MAVKALVHCQVILSPLALGLSGLELESRSNRPRRSNSSQAQSAVYLTPAGSLQFHGLTALLALDACQPVDPRVKRRHLAVQVFCRRLSSLFPHGEGSGPFLVHFNAEGRCCCLPLHRSAVRRRIATQDCLKPSARCAKRPNARKMVLQYPEILTSEPEREHGTRRRAGSGRLTRQARFPE